MIKLLLFALALAKGDEAAQVKAVEAALVTAAPKLHRCWEQAAAQSWRVEGRVSVRAVVGAGGRIDRVEVDAARLGRPEVAACVREAFVGVTLGSPFAPGDSVELPVDFKAEPNVTVKRGDVAAQKVDAIQATARILVDEQTAGKTKASLTFVEVQPSARYAPPCCKGTVVIYVSKGRAKVGGDAVTTGDVVVYPAGVAGPPIMPSLRTELLMLITPAGGEQVYRGGGGAVASSGGGKAGAVRVVKGPTAQRYTILGGKGTMDMVLEAPEAYVGRLRISAGGVVPEHANAAESEIIYVLQGKGELTVDGEKYPVEPFMAIHVPPGAKHTFTAAWPFEAVQFYAPGGPEQPYKGAK